MQRAAILTSSRTAARRTARPAPTDTCAGTRTTVTQGAVAVRDRQHHHLRAARSDDVPGWIESGIEDCAQARASTVPAVTRRPRTCRKQPLNVGDDQLTDRATRGR
jgi:hypothetical protein